MGNHSGPLRASETDAITNGFPCHARAYLLPLHGKWYLGAMTELHAIIHGRVQLVMFRDFTQRRARRLKVSGTVQNLEDGTVEVIAQGTRDSLERLLEALHGGPMLSRVDKVESEWREPSKIFNDFQIIY